VVVAQLKLVAVPSQLPGLKLALKHAGAKASRKRLPVVCTYYDSPDLKLTQQGLSLCVEQRGSRRGQGLKSLGSVDGAEVGGWWDRITTDRPDPSAGETGPRWRAIVDDAELHPLFKTQIRRTFHKVSLNSTTEIVATLGEGRLDLGTDEATEAVCELELELAQGDPTALYDLALQLLDDASLRLETRSLLELGYCLSGAEFGAVTSKPIEPTMSVETVLQNVARECVAHLLRNEPAAVSGDAMAFHQMRVALRRFRSVLSTVRPMLPVEQYRWLQGEFKWLASILAPVRDWDVFAANLIAPVQSELFERINLRQLAEAAKQRRQEAYNTAMEAIGSRRYVELLLNVNRWFVSRSWRDQPASEFSAPLFAPIANVAAPLIDRRWRQARKRSKRIGELPQEERHGVRIALKKLRYMIEFLGSLFDVEEVNALMRRLKPLQEELGHFNDVHTAQRLIEKLAYPAGNDAAEVSGQAGLVVGWHFRELTNLERRLRRDVRRFRNAKPFWLSARLTFVPFVLSESAPSDPVDTEGSTAVSS
jgi:inorganic triphosphatase YgiF